MRSWSNFGRPASPETSEFSSFVDDGSHRDSLESESLRNDFETLSRLIDVNGFVSYLFLNFFRKQHDVLLLFHSTIRNLPYLLSKH